MPEKVLLLVVVATVLSAFSGSARAGDLRGNAASGQRDAADKSLLALKGKDAEIQSESNLETTLRQGVRAQVQPQQ